MTNTQNSCIQCKYFMEYSKPTYFVCQAHLFEIINPEDNFCPSFKPLKENTPEPIPSKTKFEKVTPKKITKVSKNNLGERKVKFK